MTIKHTLFAAAMTLAVAMPTMAQPARDNTRRMEFDQCIFVDSRTTAPTYRGPCSLIQVGCTMTFQAPDRRVLATVRFDTSNRLTINGLLARVGTEGNITMVGSYRDFDAQQLPLVRLVYVGGFVTQGTRDYNPCS